MMFLSNSNSTPYPFTSGWVTVSPLLKFLLKENTGSHRGKPTGVLAIKILLFMDNRGESINIGDPYYNRLGIILIPLSLTGVNS